MSRRSLQRIRTNPVAVEDQPGHGLTDAKVTMSLPLRGQVAGSDIDDKNSLRNISKSVGNKMMYVGKQLSNLIERELDRHPMIQQRLLANIGKPLEEVDQVEEWMDNLRLDMKQLLTRNSGNINMQEQLDIEPINNGVYATCIRGHLLKFWAEVVEDPGSKVAQWLIEGAPAGMTVGTDDLDHVCPRVDVDDTDCFDPSVLSTDFDEFENYFGVETDHDASKAITQYFEKGYLKCFDTLDQLREFVGGQPILSKLGCIKKLKYNADTQAYTHKVRIILDCKQSKVSTSSRRTHKSILPRVSDAVQSALSLSADLRNDELVSLMIIDIIDAFWLIPLRHCERRFFCAKLHNKFYAFLRTAQGSRAAPLTFAAIIALAGRLIQSLMMGPMGRHTCTQEGHMHIYVDDPIAVLRGSQERTTDSLASL